MRILRRTQCLFWPIGMSLHFDVSRYLILRKYINVRRTPHFFKCLKISSYFYIFQCLLPTAIRKDLIAWITSFTFFYFIECTFLMLCLEVSGWLFSARYRYCCLLVASSYLHLKDSRFVLRHMTRTLLNSMLSHSTSFECMYSALVWVQIIDMYHSNIQWPCIDSKLVHAVILLLSCHRKVSSDALLYSQSILRFVSCARS